MFVIIFTLGHFHDATDSLANKAMLIPHFYQASLLWANCVPKYCEFKKKSQIWSFAVTNPEFSFKKNLSKYSKGCLCNCMSYLQGSTTGATQLCPG